MRHSVKDIFMNRPEKKNEDDLYKVRKVPYHKDDMRILENLLKGKMNDGRGKRGFQGGFGGGGKFNDSMFSEKRQRVMFKMSHSDSLAVHKSYLNTYMPQENKANVKEKPELFGNPESEYLENMSGLHFKCIISPENQEIDLELLSKEFIRRMEVLTGYKLNWRGAVHNDTEHRHAHLCINGKDKTGKDVYFQKELIKRTMRETLQYAATLMVGERSEREIEAARKGLVNSKRWTKLDAALETYGEKISMHNLPEELVNRLAFLSGLNLAEKHGKYYTLGYGWKNVLAAAGRYNTFLDEWRKADGNLELYGGGTVSGFCENVITFDKDEAWNDALIVNTGERRIYVPVWQLDKENLVGKEISVSGGTRSLSRQIKSSDIHFVERENKKNRRKDFQKKRDM